MSVLHLKTKTQIDAMPPDEFEEYMAWFQDANREFFAQKDREIRERDRSQLLEIKQEAQSRTPLDLSAENPKVISDAEWAELVNSGLTKNIDRFISRSAERERYWKKRRADALARQAERKTNA